MKRVFIFAIPLLKGKANFCDDFSPETSAQEVGAGSSKSTEDRAREKLNQLFADPGASDALEENQGTAGSPTPTKSEAALSELEKLFGGNDKDKK